MVAWVILGEAHKTDARWRFADSSDAKTPKGVAFGDD